MKPFDLLKNTITSSGISSILNAIKYPGTKPQAGGKFKKSIKQ